MSVNHLVRIAKLKLIKDSAELEAEISTKAPGWFMEVYGELKHRAAEALTAMAFVDASKPDDVRALQIPIRTFDEFVVAVRAVIAKGKMYDQEITEADREETLEALLDEAGGEEKAMALGLLDPPTD